MTKEQCVSEWAILAALSELSSTEEDRLAEILKAKIGITKKSFTADLKEAQEMFKELTPTTQHEIAEAFINDYVRVQYPDGVISTVGEMHVVNGGIFRKVDHGPLSIIVGDEYRSDLCQRVSDYRAIVKHTLQILDRGNDFFDEVNVPIGIPTPAGFYRIDGAGNVVVEAFDPMRHRARYITPAAPAQVPTPLLTRFLQTSITGDNAEAQRWLVQEIVGAVLFGLMATYKKATLLYGERDTGKSMLQRLLQILFPKELQSTIKPSDWSNEQYTVRLAGSRLNIAGDIPTSRVIEGDAFKSITGGDEFSGKAVYKEVQEGIRSRAAHIFSANTLPAVSADDVFFSRWLIIYFQESISKERQIVDLEKKIVADEISGLLWWAMEGAQRVVRNGGFYRTNTQERLITKWKTQANSALTFLADEDTINMSGNSNDYTRRSDLYRAYSTWCRDSNRKPFSKSHALETFDARLQPGRNNQGERGYRGLRIQQVHF